MVRAKHLADSWRSAASTHDAVSGLTVGSDDPVTSLCNNCKHLVEPDESELMHRFQRKIVKLVKEEMKNLIKLIKICLLFSYFLSVAYKHFLILRLCCFIHFTLACTILHYLWLLFNRHYIV